MKRMPELELRPENRVYTDCWAKREEVSLGSFVHRIEGSNAQSRLLAFKYLNAGVGVLDLEHPDIDYGNIDAEVKVQRAWRDYCEAERNQTGWLMRWVLHHLLPQTETIGGSRMGSQMSTLVHDRLALLATIAIARGGDEPTFFSRDNILGPSIDTTIPLLRATCQRVHKENLVLPNGMTERDVYLHGLDYFEEPPKWLPRPDLQFGCKGGAPLEGRIAIGVEAADASGTTPYGLIPYVFKKYGKPMQLIMVFLNAHPAGIKYMQESIDVPTTIVVGMMHLGLDLYWYLRGPGMFDGGKMRHLTIG
ncbi:MAG: hypothetical protein HZA95_00895 [Candidatus Vogelbacteria bacterium]|nr:hypothetical protein [Candidatus Vogelbacteria bacterium]